MVRALLPPVALTEKQAAAVMAALAALQDGPFAADAADALGAVLDALGVTGTAAREELTEKARRIGTDPVRALRGPVATVVEAALLDGVVITIDYVDAAGAVSEGRPVEPRLIGFTGGHWYLFAWCLRRSGPRCFRWDRITRAEATRTPVQERDTIAVFGIPPTGTHPAPARRPA
ncbi:WYL domain-containing protein [Frankia sp. Mgl5]|uniref:helix-turn-helix transcriptional regulator n=1 Tax=Frankia sp. Mgl5 TaxID=2933793 RepID=UPI00200CED3A|nr:WYL domain-containing protein [Frankia sp. Mgl5]MCK9926846.1 WYL domain-containing protein [Frankia sp. Mgl5]